MNKWKSFACALISETIRLFKYVFIRFTFLNIFCDSYSAVSDYTTNITVIAVWIISQFKLLKQCGKNNLCDN